MTKRELHGLRFLPLPALLLLPLLGAPAFAMLGDDYGPPFTSAGDIQTAQTILRGEHYLAAGRSEPGRMDQGTIDAVRAFQRAHAIPDGGRLDPDTFAQLTSHGSAALVARATDAAATRASRSRGTGATSQAANRGRDAAAGSRDQGRSGLRSMPETAGPVPLLAVVGAVLTGGGLLLVRRRRA